MGTRSHSLSVHANVEQGTPSAAAEGESIGVEEESNGHEFEWLKAMNREIEYRRTLRDRKQGKKAVKQQQEETEGRVDQWQHRALELEDSSQPIEESVQIEHHIWLCPL